MKKNQGLTIEELIINEVEKKVGKNILVDLLNEFLIESLEWLQIQPDDLQSYNKKVFINNTVSDLYFRTENIILDFDFLGELNYNYELLEKLNIYDYNFYTINIECTHVKNINNLINEVISLKVIDYLKDIKGILFNIIELYMFTVSVETGLMMPVINSSCEISKKNIELLNEYISYNYENEEMQRIYINGLSLDVDSCDNIPDSLYSVLSMFKVVY